MKMLTKIMCRTLGLLVLATSIITGCAPHQITPTGPITVAPVASQSSLPQPALQPISGPAPPPSVAHNIAMMQSTQHPQ